MIRNQPGQHLTVVACDLTGKPYPGDAAHISAFVSKDFEPWAQLNDIAATEEDAVKATGFYLFDLLTAETDGGNLRFSAKSTTANIVCLCLPQIVDFGSSGCSSVCCCEVLQNQQMIDLLTQLVALQRPGG